MTAAPAADRAHPDEVRWIVESWEVDAWMYVGSSKVRAEADRRLASFRARFSTAPARLIRVTTTYTVEPS